MILLILARVEIQSWLCLSLWSDVLSVTPCKEKKEEGTEKGPTVKKGKEKGQAMEKNRKTEIRERATGVCSCGK